MPNHVVQLQLHYAIGPQPGMNVLHFLGDISGMDPDIDQVTLDCIGQFVLELESKWKDCLPENVQLLGYKAHHIDPGGGPTITVTASSTFGTRTGEFSAGSTGPCIIAHYQQLDLSWRAGRIFLPGVSEDDISMNVFTTGLLDACGILCAEMLDAHTGPVIAGSWTYGVFSRTHDFFGEAHALTVSGRPGTQRGRLKPAF